MILNKNPTAKEFPFSIKSVIYHTDTNIVKSIIITIFNSENEFFKEQTDYNKNGIEKSYTQIKFKDGIETIDKMNYFPDRTEISFIAKKGGVIVERPPIIIMSFHGNDIKLSTKRAVCLATAYAAAKKLNL